MQSLSGHPPLHPSLILLSPSSPASHLPSQCVVTTRGDRDFQGKQWQKALSLLAQMSEEKVCTGRCVECPLSGAATLPVRGFHEGVGSLEWHEPSRVPHSYALAKQVWPGLML